MFLLLLRFVLGKWNNTEGEAQSQLVTDGFPFADYNCFVEPRSLHLLLLCKHKILITQAFD